jgi:membrane-associated phospholipid phosphatase
MDHWLESLVPWGTEVIAWVQAHSFPALDGVSKFFTVLGYEELYLILLPLIYWCVNRQIGIGLGYLSMLSAWLNDTIKYIFAIPRPSDPRIVMKAPRLETSPSFPSGHAQGAVANWGYLAVRFRNWVLRILFLVLIIGIGLSRIVLGVHFPQDVIAGWVIGLALLAVYALLEPHIGRWFGEQRSVGQVALVVGLPILLMLVHPADLEGRYPSEGAITPAAALVGLGVGVIMERAWVRFQVGGAWWKRFLRYLLGIVIVAALWAGPKLLVPDGLSYGVEAAIRFVRYGLLGWAVAFLCPWLFVKLRLASREI